MATPASEVGGHTASFAQAQQSVQRWLGEGLSTYEILHRLAQDLASGRIEHGEGRPCNTVVYEERDGRLYSPAFNCFISDLFEPDPNNKAPGYPEMNERNKNNLLEAERLIMQEGLKEAWVGSPASDYNSDHGVVYCYQRNGNQILMHAIDGPKDVNDLMDFVARLSGKQPQALYDEYGHTVGMTTVGKSSVTDLSKNKVIEILSSNYGDREGGLISRYEKLPHEITEGLKYFERKTAEAMRELQRTVDFNAIEKGDYSSLTNAVRAITTELKQYEHQNSMQRLEASNVADTFEYRSFMLTDSTETTKTAEQSRSTESLRVVDEVTKDALIKNFSSEPHIQQTSQPAAPIDVRRVKDPVYRVAHNIAKPEVILNKTRSGGWQSWLSVPPATQEINLKNQPNAVPRKAFDANAKIVDERKGEALREVKIVSASKDHQKYSDKKVEVIVEKKIITEQVVKRMQVHQKLNELQREKAKDNRLQRLIASEKVTHLHRKINMTSVLESEQKVLRAAVVARMQELIRQNLATQRTLQVAKVVVSNQALTRLLLTVNPTQLTKLLSLSRGMLQTLLLSQPTQVARVNPHALKLISGVIIAKLYELNKNLQRDHSKNIQGLTKLDPKLLEMRKAMIEVLKLVKELRANYKHNIQNKAQTFKELIHIDPRLRALLLQLLKLGVLDELLASDEDWLLSMMEVRRQRTKREMRFNTTDVKEKINHLKRKTKNKEFRQRLSHIKSTRAHRKAPQLAVKPVQVSARTAPSYELLPVTSIVNSDGKRKESS